MESFLGALSVKKSNIRSGNAFFDQFDRISIAELLDISLIHFAEGISASATFKKLKKDGSIISIKSINNIYT